MAQIFAYIVHKEGVLDDSAMELALAAKKIDTDATLTAIVTGDGATLDQACSAAAAAYDEVWKIGAPELAYPNAEVVRKALMTLLPNGATVLMAHDTFGMDLGPGLSVKLNSAFTSDVVDIQGVEGDTLSLVRQEFGGQVSTHVRCHFTSGVVLTVRPGCFQVTSEPSVGGQVVDKSGESGDLQTKRRFLGLVAAETGDVDITKEDVLVSIGRGIEDEDNIEIAQDLAEAMGAVVSCSRPIVDAKWMEKSRQVGTSGVTVKPKVYMACGISGSFQHLGGLKGSPFIVAINKNPKAPIFQVADVGVTGDILELLPELTEKIEKING